jgi:hypothetical protein
MATLMASAVEQAVAGFLRLTPSAVLPSRSSRNSVAISSITRGGARPGRS